MDEDEKNFRILVLLSLQRALIGMITPNMLAVYVSWTETEVFVRVLFDGTVSPDDIEGVSIIETEIIADIPTHAVRCVAESCLCAKNEMPKPRINERIVFKRAIIWHVGNR
jgi:hypothetical protein